MLERFFSLLPFILFSITEPAKRNTTNNAIDKKLLLTQLFLTFASFHFNRILFFANLFHQSKSKKNSTINLNQNNYHRFSFRSTSHFTIDLIKQRRRNEGTSTVTTTRNRRRPNVSRRVTFFCMQSENWFLI